MGRFDYTKYDETANAKQAEMKEKVIELEKKIEEIMVTSPTVGRYRALALTALEESYMWIGKAIRDNQIDRNGSAEAQEGRCNS